jgi:hypothetical protein
MSDNRALVIVEDAGETPNNDDDVFVIESALMNVDAVEFEGIFRQISEAKMDPVADLPLYGVIRIHFAFLFAQNQLPPMAITHLVVLARLLDEQLSANAYNRIRCIGVSPEYQATVLDVAANHGIPVRGTGRFGFHRTAKGFLVGLFGYLRLVVDQLFSVLCNRLRAPMPPTETVVIPHVNRFDSIWPVLERMEAGYRLVLPIPTVAWLRHRTGRYAKVNAYDPVPLNYFSSLGCTVDTVVRGTRLAWAVLIRRIFVFEIERLITDEFGVEMPNTVWYLLGNLFAEHVPSLANATVAERMLSTLDTGQLVIGSLGSRQQAILYEAIEAGIDTFHVPHSSTTGYELAPPPETVHFVPGKHVIDHLDASAQMTDTHNLIPTGRPMLYELSQRKLDPQIDWQTEAIKVFIATQPFPDDKRRQFITHVLDALTAAPDDVDVVIKIHPNESRSFYEQLVEDRSHPVDIVEEDLYSYIAAADLVVTINSNVGLEAMVMGTPVVCIDEWEPLVRARPYARYGPVPVLESQADIEEFYGALTSEVIQGLAESEREYVATAYLDGDPSRRIASILQESTELAATQGIGDA